MKYWLMKSEPNTFSFDDLKACPKQTEHWDGIRNYQARNFMRDEMKINDTILFYHSSCKTPAIIGTAVVVSGPYPDHTSWDTSSQYYDAKSTKENPRWFMVDIKYKETFQYPVTLSSMRKYSELSNMLLLKKGQRLSIQPVRKSEFLCIENISKNP